MKGMITLINSIKVDWDNIKSIKNAEKRKIQLEKAGWNLEKTERMGLNKFEMVYKKKIIQVV
jgi:hypothetical protein